MYAPCAVIGRRGNLIGRVSQVSVATLDAAVHFVQWSPGGIGGFGKAALFAGTGVVAVLAGLRVRSFGTALGVGSLVGLVRGGLLLGMSLAQAASVPAGTWQFMPLFFAVHVALGALEAGLGRWVVWLVH